MQFLIVDDDFGSRGGMAQTLKAFYPGSVVHEERALPPAIGLLDAHRSIDLVLLDLNMENTRGIETLKDLKRWCEQNDCNPRIVVVSAAADYDDTLIPAAIEHCATGFIAKGTNEEVFRSAIELTLAGSLFIPESYLRRVRQTPHADASFTPRERAVAALLIQGLTYKQIARRLVEPGRTMSDHTVRVHVQRMAWKLKVGNDAEQSGLTAKSAVMAAFADRSLRFPQ